MAMLALVACTRPPSDTGRAATPATDSAGPTLASPASSAKPIDVPTNEKDCLAAGGKWGADGYAMPTCRLATHDGGKRCSDWSECEAGCFAAMDVKAGAPATGTCAPCYHCTGGCWNEVRGGRAQGGECN
jgi:hypothetical protein